MVNFDFIVMRSPTGSISEAFNIPGELDTTFKEGLYIASRDFFRQVEKINNLSEKEKDKLKASLLKYWTRASVRCTPFGTFAGTMLVPLTINPTELIISDAKFHKRSNRLDMEYICFMIKEIEKIPVVQDQLLLFINNSIYETPLNLRYTEKLSTANRSDYKLSAVEKSDYLSLILKNAYGGTSIKQLSDELSIFADVEFEEAKQFIMEMWASNLLISNLEPCVTGPEPFSNLINKLKDFKGIDALKSLLVKVFEKLMKPEVGVGYYIELETQIKELFSTSSLNNLIQTDLFLSCEKKELDESVVKSIVNQTSEVMALARHGHNAELEVFKKKFSEKYADKIVPFAIALDADLGIGYAGISDDMSGGNPLIDDIGYAYADSRQPSGDNIKNYTLNKYLDYLNDKKEFIEITEDELKNLKQDHSKKNKFAGSSFILGALMKKEGRLDCSNFTFSLISIGGPSACNLMGRFTHGNEELLDRAREVLRAEEKEHEDIIFAEIVHLPQFRTGNVLLRPILREYEIPYVGISGAPSDNQILIDDLYLCVREGDLVLLSKRHGKRIMPRLATAHNFHFNSLPIYKFLCDLQNQNLLIGPVWDWGDLTKLKHLPRVIYKDIILRRAQWSIELSEISELPPSKESYVNFFSDFIAKKKIPQRVLLVESDNQMIIDFSFLDCLVMFVSNLRKKHAVLLEEFLFTTENCIIKDKQGKSYTNEIIIPTNRQLAVSDKLRNYKYEDEVPNRKFHPGSEWLYFKIFCSANTIDKLLIQYILPFVIESKEKQLFNKFFFIRYKEDGNHLRIRFYNRNVAKQKNVTLAFTNLLQPLLDSGVIERIVIDTYFPEIERYGGPKLLRIAEDIFDIDSLSALKILDLLDLEEENNHRIFLSMRSIDALMDDFEYSLAAKRDFFKKLSGAFLSEFGSSSLLQRNINNKYKNLQRSIFSYMDPNQDFANELEEAAEIINLRSTKNKQLAKKALAILDSKEVNISLEKLLISYVHMMVNRFFVAHQRKYELLIYHFIERYYSSVIFIQSKNMAPKADDIFA